MSEAPERIWAQDAEPAECHYTGGGWWDDDCGSTQYPHMAEYIRADLSDAAIEAAVKAERERCAGIAQSWAEDARREHRGNSLLRIYIENVAKGILEGQQ